MKLQKLYSYTRQAINDFEMIQDGDKIAVGVSGGKDSIALLYALAGVKKIIPQRIEIVAITVDLGYDTFDTTLVQELCHALEIEFHLVKTQISQILQSKIRKGTYCSLCSKMRKGALTNFAINLGCNKIAYAHHKDDLIETMMLSLLYEGQFFSFAPKMNYKETGITVIRPLIYIPEKDIIGFRNKYGLSCVKNPCPYDGNTRRQYAKDIIRQIQKDIPEIKQRMFSAILKGKIYEW